MLAIFGHPCQCQCTGGRHIRLISLFAHPRQMSTCWDHRLLTLQLADPRLQGHANLRNYKHA